MARERANLRVFVEVLHQDWREVYPYLTAVIADGCDYTPFWMQEEIKALEEYEKKGVDISMYRDWRKMTREEKAAGFIKHAQVTMRKLHELLTAFGTDPKRFCENLDKMCPIEEQ